jgi:hypothetical protein
LRWWYESGRPEAWLYPDDKPALDSHIGHIWEHADGHWHWEARLTPDRTMISSELTERGAKLAVRRALRGGK